MSLRQKELKGKKYYYLDLSYFVVDKAKTFSKYVGAKKPAASKLKQIETHFKDEIIEKLSEKKYDCKLVSKDDLIKALLFKNAFNKSF